MRRPEEFKGTCMTGLRVWLWCGIVAGVALGATPSFAKDRAFDRDWRTGVTVAPGAMTWTSENFADKKHLISEVAGSLGKTCTDNYAFLGWAVGNGGPPAIMAATRKNYETSGFSIEQKPGSIDTDTIWIAHNDAREAVILWSAVAGSTIYLSCLTAGGPAADPDKPLYLGILSALGLGGLLGGFWLLRRVRTLGAAALAWPSVAGVVTSSAIQEYKTKGGKQFIAKVAYDYSVGGTSYAGDRLRFGNFSGPLAKAEADVAKYKAGAPVEVRYDPNSPQTSVIEAGTAGISVLGLVLAITGGLLLAVAGLIAFIA